MKTSVLRPVSLILLLISSSINVVTAVRILGIFMLPIQSHRNLYRPLMRTLADKGHEITVLTPFEDVEDNIKNNGTYRCISVPKVFKFAEEVNSFDFANASPFVAIPLFSLTMIDLSEQVIQDEAVQELLKSSNSNFELIIIEQFLNDWYRAVVAHFGAPIILLSNIATNFWINPIVGNPSPPSYISDIFLGYSSQMTFGQRFRNCAYLIYNQLCSRFVLQPKFNELIQQYVPDGPNLEQVFNNVSLVLLNSHLSISQAVPFVPNMIDIGGFHLKPSQDLPTDLQEFMDRAEEGVIYFSMGSSLKSTQLPLEKRNAILSVFSKLKTRVLWKWEESDLPGQPPNVKLSKWFPQQAILAHPNLKLFITHGGILSTTEAISQGVPVLAIPVYGDQQINAKSAKNNGYGLYVPYPDLNEKTLSENINNMLQDPTFRENAKKRSALFNDRPIKPMDLAIYWIEYVIRHKGAPHLRVEAVNIPWYKYLLLDLIAFLLVSLVIFYFTVRAMLFGEKRKLKKKLN